MKRPSWQHFTDIGYVLDCFQLLQIEVVTVIASDALLEFFFVGITLYLNLLHYLISVVVNVIT